MWDRLKLFFTLWDCRFEDLNKATWLTTVYRDLSAGLITALTAIPMAMGFAVAMGLKPEQGMIAGAIACVIGRTFGGSKYQVYGPTAAFIPIIAGLIATYTAYYKDQGRSDDEAAVLAHGFLVLVSMISGVVLMLMGVFGLGKVAERVPNSIVVGFTVGIGVSIALTNIGFVLGYQTPIKGGLINKLWLVWEHRAEFSLLAFMLALVTFAMTKGLLKVSIFIPGPLIALAFCTFLAMVLPGSDKLPIIGEVPTNFFHITPPIAPELTSTVLGHIIYYVAAIVFVSGVESLLCSSMADRLANNKKTPFDPDKEFWGQGLVQTITPLINGFPCTGALARTATSIKAGAVTPLAGYFKGGLKLLLAYALASYLALVPMACIGGILLWVALNMVKPSEIRFILKLGWYHGGLMLFTALMVPLTDFLTGVLSALVLYGVTCRFFESGRVAAELAHAEETPAVAPSYVGRVQPSQEPAAS